MNVIGDRQPYIGEANWYHGGFVKIMAAYSDFGKPTKWMFVFAVS